MSSITMHKRSAPGSPDTSATAQATRLAVTGSPGRQSSPRLPSSPGLPSSPRLPSSPGLPASSRIPALAHNGPDPTPAATTTSPAETVSPSAAAPVTRSPSRHSRAPEGAGTATAPSESARSASASVVLTGSAKPPRGSYAATPTPARSSTGYRAARSAGHKTLVSTPKLATSATVRETTDVYSSPNRKAQPVRWNPQFPPTASGQRSNVSRLPAVM